METLRLYPSVVVIPKYSMADTAVPFIRETPSGPQKEEIVIPEGGEVFLNAVALHYNRESNVSPIKGSTLIARRSTTLGV